MKNLSLEIQNRLTKLAYNEANPTARDAMTWPRAGAASGAVATIFKDMSRPKGSIGERGG